MGFSLMKIKDVTRHVEMFVPGSMSCSVTAAVHLHPGVVLDGLAASLTPHQVNFLRRVAAPLH